MIIREKNGKYCQRKTGMVEKKGMNAPPGRSVRTIAGITSSQNGPSSHIDSGKAGSKKIPSRLDSGRVCTNLKKSVFRILKVGGSTGCFSLKKSITV